LSTPLESATCRPVSTTREVFGDGRGKTFHARELSRRPREVKSDPLVLDDHAREVFGNTSEPFLQATDVFWKPPLPFADARVLILPVASLKNHPREIRISSLLHPI
jgi:hypothetical protein